MHSILYCIRFCFTYLYCWVTKLIWSPTYIYDKHLQPFYIIRYWYYDFFQTDIITWLLVQTGDDSKNNPHHSALAMSIYSYILSKASKSNRSLNCLDNPKSHFIIQSDLILQCMALVIKVVYTFESKFDNFGHSNFR